MKYKLYKKYKVITIIITAGIIALLGCFVLGPSVKAVETLIDYPTVGGQDIQLGTNPTSLPEMIKYIYLFAVGICGAVALMAILLGAIKYIGAAGNSSKMGDAKEQIVSALLGVVILLSSYLILNTINPNLVDISITIQPVRSMGGQATTAQPSPSSITQATMSYKCSCMCCTLFNITCGKWTPSPPGFVGCQTLSRDNAITNCSNACLNTCTSGITGVLYKAYYINDLCN